MCFSSKFTIIKYSNIVFYLSFFWIKNNLIYLPWKLSQHGNSLRSVIVYWDVSHVNRRVNVADNPKEASPSIFFFELTTLSGGRGQPIIMWAHECNVKLSGGQQRSNYKFTVLGLSLKCH